jgi:hypothetical protein
MYAHITLISFFVLQELMDQQQKKRPRRPRGKRNVKHDDPNEEAEEHLADALTEQVNAPAQPCATVGGNSRGTSPNTTDDGCRASVLSSTSSSAALQLLKERSIGEADRRTKAFVRLEAEKESNQRANIIDEECAAYTQLMRASRNTISVLSMISAQQKATGLLFLERQHAHEKEAVEDHESEEREELFDEEVEALSLIIARQYANASRDMATSFEEVTVTAVKPIQQQISGDGDTQAHDDTDETEAHEAFASLRAAREAEVSAQNVMASSTATTRAPPTAESVCPCCLM